MGLIIAVVLALLRKGAMGGWPGYLETLAWFLLIPAVAAFLAMNFTGSSTYTSISGVKREMKWAVPMEITLAAAGLSFWLGSRFIA
jgi:acetyl-CoA decarbonylase/synthase complex subunit gamma